MTINIRWSPKNLIRNSRAKRMEHLVRQGRVELRNRDEFKTHEGERDQIMETDERMLL